MGTLKTYKPIILIILLLLVSGTIVNAQDILINSFEANSLGSINGQGDWNIESGTGMVVDAAAQVHSGTKSLNFIAQNQTMVVHNITFGSSEQGVTGVVYVDMFVKINSQVEKDFSVSGYDLFGGSEKRTFVVEFDTPSGNTGTFQIFNGGGRIDVGTYTLGEWNRISARVDYVNAGYQVIFNGSESVSASFRESYTPTASGSRPAGVKEYHGLRFNLGYDGAVGSLDAAFDDLYVSTTPIPDVNFTELVITHTIEVEDPEVGSIQLNPDLDAYPDSSEVTATLTIPEGYINDGWTGDLFGTELSKTFLIMADMEIGANVGIDPDNPPAQYTVTVTQPNYGSISLSPTGGVYYNLTEVTASLSLPPSFMNLGWTGDLSGTGLEQSFLVTSDIQIGANVVLDETPPTIYYVSTASAFEDICEADTLRPGDIIELADGSYDTGGISIESSGTVHKPIIIRAAHNGQAVLAGESYFTLRRAAHIVIQGFHFTSDRYTAIKLEACNNIRITRNTFQLTESEGENGKWVYIGGVWDDATAMSHHNRVDHNTFRDKHQLGNFITIDGGDNVSQHDRIDHNYFYNIGPRHDNEMEAIRVGWSQLSLTDGFTVIEYNLFEDCDGDPEIVSIKSGKDTVRYNTIKESQGTVSLRHGDGSVVHGNYFLGNGKSGTGGVRVYARYHKIYNNYFEGLTGDTWDAAITLTNGDTDTGSLSAHWRIDGVIIVNNTLVDNFSNIEIGYGRADNSWNREPRNVTMAHNLVVGGQADLIKIINEPTNFTWSANMMWPQNGWAVGLNVPEGEITVADPLLQYAATESDSLWFLTSESPAIDATPGNFFNIFDDIHGQERSLPEDIGADEYSLAPITRRPLTLADVGPNATDPTVSIALSGQKPESFELFRNYPNPFNPGTTLQYELTNPTTVRLEIYDLIGRKVGSLVDQYQSAGRHEINWEADQLETGIYLAVLSRDHSSQTIKLVLMK